MKKFVIYSDHFEFRFGKSAIPTEENYRDFYGPDSDYDGSDCFEDF